MKTEILNCWLCGAEADNWALTVARVCNECYADSANRLQQAGYVVSTSDPSMSDHVITVKAPAGKEPMVGLIFGPENLKSHITKIWQPEVQVGERRFDDKVYLQFADKSDLPLLKDVEVEDLIIELVKDGVVHVIGDHADIHVHGSRHEHDERQLVLMCAALINAIHVRRLALS